MKSVVLDHKYKKHVSLTTYLEKKTTNNKYFYFGFAN